MSFGYNTLGFGAFPNRGPTFLKIIDVLTDNSLTTNLKVCLDAADENSYTSGQLWSDVSGEDNHFEFGASASAGSDDPNFNGTAGDQSSLEFMSYDDDDGDGGALEFHRIASQPAMAETLHKDGAVWSACCWVYPKNHSVIFSTGSAGWVQGINYRVSGAKQSIFIGSAPTGGNYVLALTAETAMALDEWHFCGISINEPDTSGGFMYLDGGYDQVGARNGDAITAADTFDPTYNSPTTNNSTNRLTVAKGSVSSNQGPSDIGLRFGAVAMWQGSVLSKANFDTIWAASKGRYGK
jgi:hypothetical protein